jgi:hypothetical protein
MALGEPVHLQKTHQTLLGMAGIRLRLGRNLLRQAKMPAACLTRFPRPMCPAWLVVPRLWRATPELSTGGPWSFAQGLVGQQTFFVQLSAVEMYARERRRSRERLSKRTRL